MEKRQTTGVVRVKIEVLFAALCTAILIIILSWSSSLLSDRKPVPQQLEQLLHDDVFDVHIKGGEASIDDAIISHKNHLHHSSHDNVTRIAIGFGITTRDQEFLTLETLPYRLPFLKTLLPSFCKTASDGYHYHFYGAFDLQDPFLNREEYLQAIHKRFLELLQQMCSKQSKYYLHFVQCSHNRNPTWAQNDAMMEAYLDDVDFYFRVNDDTQFQSPTWTEELIAGLKNFNPPLIGVVGPQHTGGNEDILTYDFVHKTHIDIFGFYYPRIFTDWWADNWMSTIYGESRTLKLPTVRLMHTLEAGTRYKVQYDISDVVKYQIEQDQVTLSKYLVSEEKSKQPSTKVKVIAMSLWGAEPKYTYGALRNAQLVPVFYPEWRLRIYVEKPTPSGQTHHAQVPERILNKLVLLGAELVYVDAIMSRIPPMMWRFLIADDQSVDYFIVRDADGRLTERDAIFVDDWIQTDTAFHCIRDHPSHASYSILGGLWGGVPKKLSQYIHAKFEDLMKGYSGDYVMDMTFLDVAVWSRIQKSAHCHDSVSCTKWPAAHPAPVTRYGTEHLGQVFDAFGNARDGDVKLLLERPEVTECVVETNGVTQSSQKKKFMGLLFKESKNITPNPAYNSTIATNAGHKVNHSNSTTGFSEKYNHVLWSIDFDINPVRDIKHVTSSMGVHILAHSMSTLCPVSQTCANNLRVITRKNGINLGHNLVKRFFTEYEHDAEMNLVTHFLCTNPVSLCELYLPFNKPIIMFIDHRYERGRFDRENWLHWNQNLQNIASNPENTIAANNLFDAQYVKYFTGIQPQILPSVCRYVNTHYKPTNKTILISSIHNPTFQDIFLSAIFSETKKNSSLSGLVLQTIDEAYPSGWNFQVLSSHKAIVHIPQQVVSSEVCEHYAMSIPIFIPSLELLVRWHLQYNILSAVTYNSVRALMGDVSQPVPFDKTLSSPNNLTDYESLMYWMKLTDLYNKPHVVTFNSVSDLMEKILTTDLNGISEKMSVFNKKQWFKVTRDWQLIIKGV